MNIFLIRSMRLAICFALSLLSSIAAWGQLPPAEPAPLGASTPIPVFENCRPLTDKAMDVDMQAANAQSQKRELSEQLRLYEEAVARWSQAMAQCDGRAKDRAQRNLADSQKVRTGLQEQLGAGPQCEAAHKDAGALQEMARQALGERRFDEAAMLFRKTENRWDVAFERCAGSQQEVAGRRRDQSEMDAHNAEHCAPLFEKARDQHQKLRTTAAGLARQDRHDASHVTETLWREALGSCKGAVLETVRNNAQAVARERGTPWVARSALGATPNEVATTPASENLRQISLQTPMGNSVATTPANLAAMPEMQAADFMAGAARFSGSFLRDSDGPTYSGSGKVVWVGGDSYEGQLLKGLRHGKGVFTWANGQRYSGDWVKDVPTGQASLQFVGGNHYEGSITKGEPQGTGRMRYGSGDVYTGQFNAGFPEGRGLFIWKNGQQLDGEWKNRQLNGQGRMTFVDGAVYVGQFVDGKFDGQGNYRWLNGDDYTGQWKFGKKHGRGTFSWKNRDFWEGVYENDAQTSDGTLTQKN